MQKCVTKNDECSIINEISAFLGRLFVLYDNLQGTLRFYLEKDKKKSQNFNFLQKNGEKLLTDFQRCCMICRLYRKGQREA